MPMYIVENRCGRGLIDVNTDLAEHRPELQERQRACLSCESFSWKKKKNEDEPFAPTSAAPNRFLQERTKIESLSHSVMDMRPERLTLNLLKKKEI